MKKFSLKEVISWRFIVWGNNGSFPIDVPVWLVEVEAIIDYAVAECRVRDYDNVWVEIIGEDEDGDIVCAEDLFKYNRKRIMMLERKKIDLWDKRKKRMVEEYKGGSNV